MATFQVARTGLGDPSQDPSLQTLYLPALFASLPCDRLTRSAVARGLQRRISKKRKQGNRLQLCNAVHILCARGTPNDGIRGAIFTRYYFGTRRASKLNGGIHFEVSRAVDWECRDLVWPPKISVPGFTAPLFRRTEQCNRQDPQIHSDPAVGK